VTTFKHVGELEHGDMVSDDLMRLLVDRPLRASRGWEDETVWQTEALIANAAYLRDQAARGNGHAAAVVNLADPDGEQLRWTIQGNVRRILAVMSEFEVKQARADEAERMAAPQPVEPSPVEQLTAVGYSVAQAEAALAIPAPARYDAQISVHHRAHHRSEERQGFLHDVFVTGLEGGIGYWSVATRYRHSDVATFQAVLLPNGESTTEAGVPAWGVWDDTDPRETAPLAVDADVIARGLGLYRQWAAGRIDYCGNPIAPEDRAGGNRRSNDVFKQVLLADRTNYREGDIDSTDADTIIQFGVFGQAVFG
jgi:hypothetical protein